MHGHGAKGSHAEKRTGVMIAVKRKGNVHYVVDVSKKRPDAPIVENARPLLAESGVANPASL